MLIKPHHVLAKEVLSHFTGDGALDKSLPWGPTSKKGEGITDPDLHLQNMGRGLTGVGGSMCGEPDFGESLQLLSVFGVEPGSSWVLPWTAVRLICRVELS